MGRKGGGTHHTYRPRTYQPGHSIHQFDDKGMTAGFTPFWVGLASPDGSARLGTKNPSNSWAACFQLKLMAQARASRRGTASALYQAVCRFACSTPPRWLPSGRPTTSSGPSTGKAATGVPVDKPPGCPECRVLKMRQCFFHTKPGLQTTTPAAPPCRISRDGAHKRPTWRQTQTAGCRLRASSGAGYKIPCPAAWPAHPAWAPSPHSRVCEKTETTRNPKTTGFSRLHSEFRGIWCETRW